jgi:hypothetical protein
MTDVRLASSQPVTRRLEGDSTTHSDNFAGLSRRERHCIHRFFAVFPVSIPEIADRFRVLRVPVFAALALATGAAADPTDPSDPARFLRAINLNGPAAVIAGQGWQAEEGAVDFTATGQKFENQAIVLRPPLEVARTQMVRSSRFGSRVELTFSNLPAGTYQVVLHVWEDTLSEEFALLVNGVPVIEEFHSGGPGTWHRLGPWVCESVEGKVTVAAQGPGHGGANLSGIELWAGSGPVPPPPARPLVAEPTPEQVAFFESKVRPVLVNHCYECHSAKSVEIKGGLLLDSRAGLLKGGDHGPPVTAGDPSASLLIQSVRRVLPDYAMPPKVALAPEEIDALTEWVAMGAPDPRTADTVAAAAAKHTIDWDAARQWWSLRPLSMPAVPAVQDASWPLNEIDRFILAGLEKAGLAPAPDASARVLARRLSYTLTGLPPTPDEVESFRREMLGNPDTAVPAQVDRLLASPRHGERWGRHWLDVVRYADTAGDNSDFPIPQHHLYRDWVIDAFQRDLPYDRFVREQLAGDLLPDRTTGQLVATGYLANSRRFGSRVEDYPQHLTIEDTLDNLGRAFLGLTINCARCHDHKFDPITTADYYALYGIFSSTRYPWPGIELDQKQRDLVPMVPAGEVDAATTALQSRRNERARLRSEIGKLDGQIKKAAEGEARTALEEKRRLAAAALDTLDRTPAAGLAYAMADAPRAVDARIQLKGDPAKPGPAVPRRFLTVLGGSALPEGATGSGRLELADWILAPTNPLTARVMVNRIWLHHFGTGLVPTPNDFGRQGKPPTHPELLDWLAARFIAEGWSVKAMHRLILGSRTYRQASAAASPDDPNNHLLGRFPRLRLDAEAIRDTLLWHGGGLDLAPGGAHPFPPEEEWKFTQHNPFKAVYDTNRRSVYLMTQRIQRHPYLAIFDGADPSTSTPVRGTSTTPLQALFLLNDPLVHAQAKGLAANLRAAAPDQADAITLAFHQLLARPPTVEESARSQTFLDAARATLRSNGTPDDQIEPEAWTAFARSLFRLSEFVYLD